MAELGDYPTITKEELQKKIGQPGVVVYDVLTHESYDTLHIKGTLSLPLDHILGGAWESFDRNNEYVVYCADYDCDASKMAAGFLKEKGFNVSAYEGGVKEWSQSGLPVEGLALKTIRIKPKKPGEPTIKESMMAAKSKGEKETQPKQPAGPPVPVY